MWRKPGSINLPAPAALPWLEPGGRCGLEAGAPAPALPGLAAPRQETYLQLP